jgi:SAM-dependent methyltransferase
MRSIEGVGVDDVAAAYGGSQADFYRLLFGELLHVGGMAASADLAKRGSVVAGMRGVDMCCGLGAAMRFLVRTLNVESMVGVDVTPRNVERGQERCRVEGLDGRVQLLLADATETGLPPASADFIWAEDAWCYVPDKAKLVAEAARLVRPGGTIAFTDWVEGPVPLEGAEAERFLRMMRFATLADIADYRRLLSACRCEATAYEDTGRMPAHFDLYVEMIDKQLGYDALATVDYRPELLSVLTDNLRFIGALAHAGKLIQARFIAHRPA